MPGTRRSLLRTARIWRKPHVIRGGANPLRRAHEGDGHVFKGDDDHEPEWPACASGCCVRKGSFGFASKITLRKNEDGAPERDAKSILMVMGMGLGSGSEVEISAEGADEQEAVDALVALIESGCGE